MPRHNDENIKPFNPLDKHNLGESVADALLEAEVQLLPSASFRGAGVYAIYYTGDFPAYKRLSDVNRNGILSRPIYVGKAVPSGSRRGGFEADVTRGTPLWRRLSEHSDSIKSTRNLDINDFRCRFLIVDDIWIPLAESVLIDRFRPVWNRVLDGFGNHDPGIGRQNSKVSPWDCLHPGRAWTENLHPCAVSSDELERRVIEFLTSE
jgi:hypothetical protein